MYILRGMIPFHIYGHIYIYIYTYIYIYIGLSLSELTTVNFRAVHSQPRITADGYSDPKRHLGCESSDSTTRAMMMVNQCVDDEKKSGFHLHPSSIETDGEHACGRNAVFCSHGIRCDGVLCQQPGQMLGQMVG